MRIPSSLVRCATVYDATPKIPIEASSSPSRLKNALVAATMRSLAMSAVDFLAHRPDADQQPRVHAPDLLADRRRDGLRVARGADLQRVDAIRFPGRHLVHHRARLLLRTPASLASRTTPMMSGLPGRARIVVREEVLGERLVDDHEPRARSKSAAVNVRPRTHRNAHRLEERRADLGALPRSRRDASVDARQPDPPPAEAAPRITRIADAGDRADTRESPRHARAAGDRRRRPAPRR